MVFCLFSLFDNNYLLNGDHSSQDGSYDPVVGWFFGCACVDSSNGSLLISGWISRLEIYGSLSSPVPELGHSYSSVISIADSTCIRTNSRENNCLREIPDLLRILFYVTKWLLWGNTFAGCRIFPFKDLCWVRYSNFSYLFPALETKLFYSPNGDRASMFYSPIPFFSFHFLVLWYHIVGSSVILYFPAEYACSNQRKKLFSCVDYYLNLEMNSVWFREIGPRNW